MLHLVLEFLDPVGCWMRPPSGYSCCQLVLTLHVTPKLCSANECRHQCQLCIHQALRCAHLKTHLPCVDILGNPSFQVLDVMIDTDPQFECEMGHWLPYGCGNPGR